MGLIGTGTAFIAALVAEFAGNSKTRPFSRTGFGIVALTDMGLTLSGLASFGYDVLGTVA